MTNKQAAITIVKQLRDNGFEALFAGGCVRDMLLKRRANDYDVVTGALPKQVVKLFKRTVKVGARFGVIIVLIKNQQVEVATFRTDAEYADGRHPTAVKFTSAVEDAARRDFTINGMFYDPINRKLIDYVNGQGDLKSGIIRTIGKPQHRFTEDYLRMLRAVRFSTQLGFDIEPKTLSAICANAEHITKISGERIAMELQGLLAAPRRAGGVIRLVQTRLAEKIFPGISRRKTELAVKVLHHLPRKVDFPLALTALFAGCDTEFAIQKTRLLKLSRNQYRHVKFLLDNRGKLLNREMSLAELKMVLAEPYFNDLFDFQKAIQKAQGKTTAPLTALRKKIKTLGDVPLKPKPLLNGHELIKLGAAPGPSVGYLAQELYIAQLEGRLTTTQQARKWTRDWLKKHKIEN